MVIRGKKQFIIDKEVVVLEAGESIKSHKNTKVQYTNPFSKPCKYVTICLPAFRIKKTHREED